MTRVLLDDYEFLDKPVVTVRDWLIENTPNRGLFDSGDGFLGLTFEKPEHAVAYKAKFEEGGKNDR